MSAKINSVQIGQINRVAIEAAAPSGIIVIDLIHLKRLALVFLKNNWLNGIIFVLTLYLVLMKMGESTASFDDSVAASATNATGQRANLPQKNFKQKEVAQASLIASALKENNDNVGDNVGEDKGLGVVEVLPQRVAKPVKSAYANGGNDANLFDNVSIFVAPERANAAVVKSKKDKCWDYVRRFIGIAKSEKQKFGIPVSITLAQGLLESDAGDSRLTRAANNHFGVKTFNKRVPHVVMKDDSPTDKFKKYDSAWESYRDHSLLLMRDHYKPLQYLSKTDYVSWAKGLQKAGYATDPQYAAKLIKIIENLQLFKLDEV